MPELPDTTNRRVFAETWAALSVGVLVLALAVILWFRLLPIAPTILLLVIGYLAIESFAQRRVETLLLRITVILAAIASILLAFHYLRELLLVGLGALGLFILVDNAGEIVRARRGRRKRDVATVLDAAGPVVWEDPEPVDGPLPDEAPVAGLPEPPSEDRTTVMSADAEVANDEVAREVAETRSVRTRSLAPDGLIGTDGRATIPRRTSSVAREVGLAPLPHGGIPPVHDARCPAGREPGRRAQSGHHR